MSKVYTKAELFKADMTLDKLRKIATSKNVAFEGDASKGTIANAILQAQRTEELESESVDGIKAEKQKQLDVANGNAKTVLEANAAKESRQSVADENAVAAKAGEDMKTFEAILDAINKNSKAIGILAEGYGKLFKEFSGRVGRLEEIVAGLEGGKKNAETLHGSVDTLGSVDKLAVGKIDDLKKI